MSLHLSFNTKDSQNDKFRSLYREHDFNQISKLDYWFVLHNDDEIIAECSVIIENDNIYEINDVLVVEKFRGNKYAELLIINILLYFEEQNRNLIIKIMCEKDNIAAYNTYNRIFGDSYRTDSRYHYFFYQL